jgi:hypothetical protein
MRHQKKKRQKRKINHKEWGKWKTSGREKDRQNREKSIHYPYLVCIYMYGMFSIMLKLRDARFLRLIFPSSSFVQARVSFSVVTSSPLPFYSRFLHNITVRLIYVHISRKKHTIIRNYFSSISFKTIFFLLGKTVFLFFIFRKFSRTNQITET